MTTAEMLFQLDEAIRDLQSAKTELKRANRPSHYYEVSTHLSTAIVTAREVLDELPARTGDAVPF